MNYCYENNLLIKNSGLEEIFDKKVKMIKFSLIKFYL